MSVIAARTDDGHGASTGNGWSPKVDREWAGQLCEGSTTVTPTTS